LGGQPISVEDTGRIGDTPELGTFAAHSAAG